MLKFLAKKPAMVCGLAQNGSSIETENPADSRAFFRLKKSFGFCFMFCSKLEPRLMSQGLNFASP
jgi:hypothetical protein